MALRFVVRTISCGRGPTVPLPVYVLELDGLAVELVFRSPQKFLMSDIKKCTYFTVTDR